jgi:outer membrane biosynthesis protein TonB
MIAIAADRYDLPRWILSAAVVVGIHAALVTMLINWREPISGDEGTDAILVDLAPYTAPQVDSKNDLAPGPEQQEAKSIPDAEPPKAQETPLEKIEPPPPLPDADVQLPAEVKPPEKPKEQPTPPVHETTSPPRPSRLPRKLPHGTARSRCKSNVIKAIPLPRARGIRWELRNWHFRSIETGRFCRAA